MPTDDKAHILEALLGIQSAPRSDREPGYELWLDTFVQSVPSGIRAWAVSTTRKLLFRIGAVFVDVEIESEDNSDSGSLIGQILDSSNPGRPLSGISVVLLNRDRNIASTSSDENGEFQFQFALESNLKLSVAVAGRSPVSLPITNPPAKWEVVRTGSGRET